MFDLSHFDFDLNRDSDLIDFLMMDAVQFPPEESRHFIPIEYDEELERETDTEKK